MNKLEQNLGYEFADSALLDKALRHRSVDGPSNERLEFIGDSIVGFVIASELFIRYPSFREGTLSQLRASLVREETLVKLAEMLELGEFLQLGGGEKKSGGFRRPSILADAMEAVIGAIYLDAGIEVCRRIVLAWYDQKFTAWDEVEIKDSKSILQEYLQANKMPLPQYEVVVSGEAHAQSFQVKCRVEGLVIVTSGTGTSRQKAEQEAAQKFLVELTNE